MVLLSTAPDAAPINVRVAVLTSSSVNVTWSDPPPDKRNGIIREFTISYGLEADNELKYLPVKQHHQIVAELLPFTKYLFAVAARTIIGEGPYSDPVYVTTPQDGKLSCIILCHPKSMCYW